MFPVIYPLKIKHTMPYQLWLCGRPSPEWLVDDITKLTNAGAKTWVCLMEEHELNEQGLTALPATCESLGMNYYHFPIADRQVPIDFSRTIELLEIIGRALTKGHVVMHCRAGIGRTGMIAAATLMHYGMSKQPALDLVSEARRVQVPDTQQQADWLDLLIGN